MAYDGSIREGLLRDFQQLRTFEDVAKWDGAAQAEAERMQAYASDLESKRAEVLNHQEALAQERARKSFFARLFSGSGPLRQLDAQSNALSREATHVMELADELQERVDMTPDNVAEQRAVLKELRLKKKELTLARKEVAAEMKEIQVAARQASANVGVSIISRALKTTAADRRSIRYRKEQLLKPRENSRAGIDRQIAAVERRILWVQRFGSDDSE